MQPSNYRHCYLQGMLTLNFATKLRNTDIDSILTVIFIYTDLYNPEITIHLTGAITLPRMLKKNKKTTKKAYMQYFWEH